MKNDLMIEKQGERISPKTMLIHNSNNLYTDLQSHNFIPTSNKYYNNFGRVFMPKISILKRVPSTSIYTKKNEAPEAFNEPEIKPELSELELS